MILPGNHSQLGVAMRLQAYQQVSRLSKRFYECILVKSGSKHTRTDRKNISVESAHWPSVEPPERVMTDARLLTNCFDTRNMIGWSNKTSLGATTDSKFGLPVVEIGFICIHFERSGPVGYTPSSCYGVVCCWPLCGYQPVSICHSKNAFH